MKVARRFDGLGDLASMWREFTAEYEEIVAEADRRIAAGLTATRALRDTRERCVRNAGGFLESHRQGRTSGALEEWRLLASAIRWTEDLEVQLTRDAGRARDRGRASRAPSPLPNPDTELADLFEKGMAEPLTEEDYKAADAMLQDQSEAGTSRLIFRRIPPDSKPSSSKISGGISDGVIPTFPPGTPPDEAEETLLILGLDEVRAKGRRMKTMKLNSLDRSAIAKKAAKTRAANVSATKRSAIAKKADKTRAASARASGRSAIAKKAARTRAANARASRQSAIAKKAARTRAARGA